MRVDSLPIPVLGAIGKEGRPVADFTPSPDLAEMAFSLENGPLSKHADLFVLRGVNPEILSLRKWLDGGGRSLLERVRVYRRAPKKRQVRRFSRMVMMKKLIPTAFLLAWSLHSQQALATEDAVLASVKAVEAELGARVGVAVLDKNGNSVWEHRSAELFPMASTFKVLACAALLSRVDDGKEQLGRTVEVVRSDLVDHSPELESRVGEKVSLADLCEATMTTSDNAAANKILEALGGPVAVTQFVRRLGDRVTRLDRNEPTVNEGKPGDPRDTTSPASIASTVQKLVAGNALSVASRERLTAWLLGNQTGGPLLRSELPSGWRVGDRTGAGGFGTRGVVAAIWPPDDRQWFVAVYVTQTTATIDQRNAAIASIGKALSGAVFEKR